MSKIILTSRDIARKRVADGAWLKETISDLWHSNAKKYPAREALTSSRERLTWKDADLQATRVTLGLLELGFERDDVLVIQLPSCIDAFILRTACDRAGIVFATPQITLREQEMAFVLKETGARGVVIPHHWRGHNFLQRIQNISRDLPHLKYTFISNGDAPDGTILISDLRSRPLENQYPSDDLAKTAFKTEESMMLALTGGTTGVPKLVENPYNGRLTAYYHLARVAQ